MATEDHALSDESEEDSDEELQRAFASGKVKPGLIHVVEKEKKIYVNKVPEINEKLNQMRLEMGWLESLDVTCDINVDEKSNDAGKMPGQDDFKREMKFYKQAEMAVSQALPQLKKLGIPIARPADYFAEMVKTDDHMQKVRQKLLSKELSMEKSEKAKKLRAMKKFGKKVQQEVIQKRQQEKKQMLESVKKFRKGQKAKPEFLQDDGDDEFNVSTERGTKRHGQDKATGKSFKRQRKDVKYGFGGKKRTMKRNTADSTADMRSFSSVKNGKGSRTNQQKNKRVGKSRRQNMKGK